MIIACDGIWDCYTNEQAAKFARSKREKGPKNGKQITDKLNKQKSVTGSSTKSSSTISSGVPSLQKQPKSESVKKGKGKGETSFIIEEMMD